MSPIRTHPGVRRIEPAEDVQQRALPDSRRAHDGHHLALLDRDVETLEHLELAGAGLVALGDVGRG